MYFRGVKGAGETFDFPLVTAGEQGYLSGATIATGDARIMKDGGAWNDTTNLFVDEDEGVYSITLTDTEMNADRITVKIVDQTGTQEWDDQSIVINNTVQSVDLENDAITASKYDESTAFPLAAAISTAVLANFIKQYDGTGLIGGTFPSSQDQISAISGALTLPAVAESRVLDDGTETNTFADTATHDEVFYVVTDNDNSDPGISVTLRGDIGDATGSHIHMHGFFEDGSAPLTNTCLMQAFIWETSVFETIRVLQHATEDQLIEPDLLARHVSTTSNGPAGAEGKIDIRFLMAAQDGGSGSSINIDHLEYRFVNPTLTASDVWTFATRVLTAGTNLNDISPAEVNAQMLDVLTVDTFAEPSSVPAATASLKDKIGFIVSLFRNKATQTAGTSKLRNDADDADIAESTTSDAAGTTTRGEWT